MKFLGRAALGLVLSFVTIALLAYAGFSIYEARKPSDDDGQSAAMVDRASAFTR